MRKKKSEPPRAVNAVASAPVVTEAPAKEEISAPAPEAPAVLPASGGKATSSLDALRASMQAAKRNAVPETAAPHSGHSDEAPPPEISPAQLSAALEALKTQLKDLGKLNIAAILDHARHELAGNVWQVTVNSSIHKGFLDKDESLTTLIRAALSAPSLYLSVQVEETVILSAEDSLPYTEEDKLSEMKKRNPVLEALQDTFNARILYQ